MRNKEILNFASSWGGERKKGFRKITEIKSSKGEKEFSKKIKQMGISDKRNSTAKA